MACNGADGDTDADGGDGGDVKLTSATGSITIGVDQSTGKDARSGSAATHIGSGNGASGGDGHFGGAGGDGGDILLQCPQGTLTICQAQGMFHIGNGGHGGTGVVGGQDLSTTDLPEQLTNGGGDAGGIGVDYQTIAGVVVHDVTTSPGAPGARKYGVFDAGVGSGGIGGDAGGYYYGVDPGTGNSTWPSTPTGAARDHPASPVPVIVEVRGDDGGDGPASGGDAAPLKVDMSGAAVPDGARGPLLVGHGGTGGYGGADLTLSHTLATLYTSWDIYGGRGSDVTCVGYPGGDGADCVRGARGGEARAWGGGGGYTATVFANQYRHSGGGGDAVARGGTGGVGGPCCSAPPRRGGRGGQGGAAAAYGGGGGDAKRGPGGDAEAFGGNGGRGGDGVPPGSGGAHAVAATADVYAKGGEGDPPGRALGEHSGRPGAAGQRCAGLLGSISGTLTEADGTPVDNFHVRVIPTGAGKELEAFTDVQGRYEFRNVAAGSYDVVPDAPGSQAYWDPPKRTVTKEPFRDLVNQDFVRRPKSQIGYTVTVPVFCQFGLPNNGIVIVLWGPGLSGTLRAVSGAGGDGLAEFHNIPPGTFKTKVDTTQSPAPTGHEWSPSEMDVQVVDRDVTTAPFQPVAK